MGITSYETSDPAQDFHVLSACDTIRSVYCEFVLLLVMNVGQVDHHTPFGKCFSVAESTLRS